VTHNPRSTSPGSTPAAIRLESVTKVFPGANGPAVDNLSLEIPEGALTAFVGPSGCGKTTTLKLINRLIEPTSGSIWVGGTEVGDRPVHELRRGIGYVIQQIGLFPHRTVAANIATVPGLVGWDRRRTRDRVQELVELVGLDPALLERYPSELSGGQQQRVGVARALAVDPPVLLMDEPYSAVDPIVRARLQDELLRLQEQVRKTIVLVTHDIDEAIKLSDRIALFNVGGVLEQLGTPEELLRNPANAFVEEFLGAERGLKRLALLKVRDLGLSPGPVVSAGDGPAEAKEVMNRFNVDWVGVVDGGALAGWVPAAALDGVDRVGDAPLERFSAWVGPDTAVRQALDTIVTSRTPVAVVLDGDRYLGMVFLAQISEGVR